MQSDAICEIVKDSVFFTEKGNFIFSFCADNKTVCATKDFQHDTKIKGDNANYC